LISPRHRPHQPHHFLSTGQQHQRRPELYADRAPEPPPARIGDLQMPHARMRGERRGDQGLRTAAGRQAGLRVATRRS